MINQILTKYSTSVCSFHESNKTESFINFVAIVKRKFKNLPKLAQNVKKINFILNSIVSFNLLITVAHYAVLPLSFQHRKYLVLSILFR